MADRDDYFEWQVLRKLHEAGKLDKQGKARLLVLEKKLGPYGGGSK